MALVVQGFLKLSSTDETPIEIEVGNTGLSSPGAVSDIQNIGFNLTEEDPTGNSYTVTGTRLTDAQVAATLSQAHHHRAGRPDPERCRDL